MYSCASDVGNWNPLCGSRKMTRYMDPRRSLPSCAGGLLSMPQPYRISEIDKRYRELLAVLQQQPDQPAAIMPQLLNLATVDDRLHEVANAIGVMWLALGQPDKGLQVLRQMRRLVPEDEVIAHNLTGMAATAAGSRVAAASNDPAAVHAAPDRPGGSWAALRWFNKAVRNR